MRPVLEDDDDDAEEDVGGHRTDAFERRYLDERSWEALAEDEHGRLVASTTAAVQRKRVRAADTGERVRRGLIRCTSRRPRRQTMPRSSTPPHTRSQSARAGTSSWC